jgi:hypothetical protein
MPVETIIAENFSNVSNEVEELNFKTFNETNKNFISKKNRES